MSVLTSPRSRDTKRTYLAAPERRAEILRHALGVFAEKGYHSASIADVCARAGIGRATLYQYFEDKRALLVALADGIAERVIEAIEARPPARIPDGVQLTEGDVIRFMEHRLRGVLAVLFESADTARLVLRAGRGADGVVDDILRRVDAALLDRVAAELADAQRSGLLREFDPAFAARFFLGGIEKVAMSYLEEGRPLDHRAIAREATSLQLFGIGARPRAQE